MNGFTVYQPVRSFSVSTECTAKLNKSDLRFTKAAADKYLKGVERVHLGYKPENYQIALFTKELAVASFKVMSDKNGKRITAKNFIKANKLEKLIGIKFEITQCDGYLVLSPKKIVKAGEK